MDVDAGSPACGAGAGADRDRPRSSRTSRASCTRPTETLRLCVLCLVAEGHLIIEDFPGVGKTMLAKALARSVDCSFSRLQFTPDLLPSDVTGVNVFNQRANEFEFRPGPGVREHPARRRDQPRVAEDAGRAARVHAGEPGHRRRRHVPARAAVHGDGDAEPDRVRGHVPAARGAARPLHDAHRDRLPAARRRGADARRADERRRRSTRSRPVADGGRRARPRSSEARDGLRRGEPRTGTSSRCCGRRARTRGSTSARARARASRCSAWRRRARSPTARDYLVPDDVKAVAAPVLAHRLILAPEARAAGLDGDDARRASARADAGPGDDVPPRPLRSRASASSSTSAPGRSARAPLYPVAVGLVLAVGAAVALGSVSSARCRLAPPLPGGDHDCSRATTCASSCERRAVDRRLPPRTLVAHETLGGSASARVDLARAAAAALHRRVRADARPARPLRVRERPPSARGSVRARAARRPADRARRRCSSTRGSSSSSGCSRRAARTRRTDGGCSFAGRAGSSSTACASTSRASRCGSVHWRSTAHRGQLMVKELEDAPRDEVVVLLDGDATCRATLRRRRARGRLDPPRARARGSGAASSSSTPPRARSRRSARRRRTGRARSRCSRPPSRPRVRRLALLEAAGSAVARSLELVVVTSQRSTRALVDRLVQRALSRRSVSLVYVDARASRAPQPGLLRLQAAGDSRRGRAAAATISRRCSSADATRAAANA